MSAIVEASHVLCAIGSGTPQAWAAARGGIGRITNSRVMNRHGEPIPMGLVPETALAPLAPEIDRRPFPPRARRLMRLAAPSLRAVATGTAGPVVLALGLPQMDRHEAPWMPHLPAYLQALTGVPVDRERSALFPFGRAASLMALEHALELLRREPPAEIVVGGVDTFFDLRLLATLDHEDRLLGRRAMDGFIPGEGAAFLRLSAGARGSRAPRQVVIDGAASVMDAGHRYGDAPARGEGLAAAIENLRHRLPEAPAPVATTFAGFNGEHFDAKLWGVARLRHHDFFAPDMRMEHPADKFGDTGAAAGAILVSLAAHALASGTRPGPALVWAASDREPRACALVTTASH